MSNERQETNVTRSWELSGLVHLLRSNLAVLFLSAHSVNLSNSIVIKRMCSFDPSSPKFYCVLEEGLSLSHYIRDNCLCCEWTLNDWPTSGSGLERLFNTFTTESANNLFHAKPECSGSYTLNLRLILGAIFLVLYKLKHTTRTRKVRVIDQIWIRASMTFCFAWKISILFIVFFHQCLARFPLTALSWCFERRQLPRRKYSRKFRLEVIVLGHRGFSSC